ncbi:MAG TPA: S1C family serine protease, partial [Azospirillum sp.]|nr:S1C family serine protease [Azospirillum sp.]
MRDGHRILAAFLLLLLTALPARGAEGEAKPDAAALMRAIVRIDVTTPPDSQSARTLGAERAGTGTVIDGNGLILTIGYLIMEGAQLKVTDADGRGYPAEFVAYDQVSGFGLVRAGFGFKAQPLRLGNAGALKAGDAAVVLSRAGGSTALPVRVVDRREFAGYWEYLLDDAIFTSPPHPAFGGAALVDGTGRLVGVGSLIVGDAVPGQRMAGNMFVPVSALEPIFGDLLAYGRRQDTPRPWLGVNVREEQGRLLVERVTPRSPAESAGVRPGDQIVGVGGQRF